MKSVLTAEQMREVDRRTVKEFGVPSIDLMENAARSVFDVVADRCGGSVAGKFCTVLCGKGNNGGDGMAVARLLWEAGARVDVLLCGLIDEMKGDARINADRYKGLANGSSGILEINTIDKASNYWAEITSAESGPDVIIDSVFGTGLDRPVEGAYANFLGLAMEYSGSVSPAPLLVSIDLPSGVDADKAEPIGFSFAPDLTVTFTAPKMANILPPVCHIQGELFISGIGSPVELVENVGSRTFLTEPADIRGWLNRTEFQHNSYKKTRGSLLVIAGSKSYPGAAVLAGNGAMRSGVGIVTVATPESAYQSVSERILAEVMVRSVAETKNGAVSLEARNEISDLAGNADAILLGCGMTSDEDDTRALVRETVRTRKAPVVLDADGLNALSPFKAESDNGPPLILTPHEGEFRRLTGSKVKLSWNERIEAVREFAVNSKAICVLKGEKTLVASPSGRIYVNPTGNSGLGKAGNGDNLAGIIGGFAAQAWASLQSDRDQSISESSVLMAVVSAVYIAGLAGDIAERKLGKRVMIASDVRECLAEAFQTTIE